MSDLTNTRPLSSGSILLLWDRMGDYHRARWKALADISEETVFAADLFASDNLYKWESTKKSFNYVCLSQNSEKRQSYQFFDRLCTFRKLLKNSNIKTVFIPGYQHSIYLIFILLARFYGCRVVMFAESWYRSQWLVERLKSFFLRSFVDVFFVSGARAKFHFSNNLNIPTSKILTGYSVVDNNHFAHSSIRNKESKPILLCVARYAPEKNLVRLIDSFVSSKLYANWQLVLLGDGPDRKSLEQYVQNHQNIELTGWKHYHELPEWYAKASCFVLPSTFEPWGLSINEAMAAGLPIIISNECGCEPDLLTDKNGWKFMAQDYHSLITILDTLNATSEDQLSEMGVVSKSIIENYSVDYWANIALGLHKR